ncbi:hypothetical protein Taro_024399 [Colocasia esculenta]|uniref:Uncharacterized protein n=1 Tax=Colocasia esculenta TaxID=4460 RepID=A0A843V992_COLES|nr:hypothetical protein [Colocasia esculenta]
MLRSKTRSRLMDPSPLQSSEVHWRAPSSDRFRSGPLGQQQFDEDDDDPFLDEDLPDEYRRRHARFSVLIVLEWISLILIVGALACSLSIPSLERQTLWNLHLWKWELMVLVLICGRLVSGWGIRVVVFLIERNFLLRKRVLYFVYGLRRAVQNCLWLGLVLMAWYCIFDEKLEREGKMRPLSYTTKILICLLVATVVRLLKTIFVKVLASSFHVSTYFDRIQESLFNQYVIETLSGPPVVEDEQLMAEVQKLRDAGATVPPPLGRAGGLVESRGGISAGRRTRGSQSTICIC